MKLKNFLIILIIFIFCLFPKGSFAKIFINQDTILGNDIFDEIEVVADNVVFDCNGYKIKGPKTDIYGGNGTAITLTQRNNITIKNCNIDYFSVGILIGHYSKENKILSNNLTNISSAGISIFRHSDYNEIFNNSINSINNFSIPNYTPNGIQIEQSSSNIIESNTIKNNTVGISSIGSLYNTINNNKIFNNTSHGIAIQASSDNLIENNEIKYQWTGIGIIGGSNIIKNNLITNSSISGFEFEETKDSIISENTIINNKRGLWFKYQSINNTINKIYHNNIYSNWYYDIQSLNAIELSYNQQGNYWGHDSPPCFYKFGGSKTPHDSNRADVIDSYPYCQKDGWSIDSTPPDTSIISSIDNDGNNISNNSSTFSDSLTFTFSGTDNVGVVGFQCSLDNSVFENCSSQKTYANLSIGNHIFKVRAKDAAGNIDDTPAIFSWNIKPLPVILLPGILGSWTDNLFEPFTNPNSIDQSKLFLTEESQAWFWRQLDDLGYLPHTWQDLKTKLPELGYPTYKCPFDWRNSNEYSTQNYLMPCIDKAKQETGAGRVNIVAHSMGGLTTRAYIQNDSLYRNDINKFAMVGTPNHGSPSAYYSWEGGSLSSLVSTNISSWSGIMGAIFENTVGDRLTQMATHFLRTGKTIYVHSFFPSLQELLPSFDYLENQFGGVRNVLSMVWQNNFLNDLNYRSNISKLSSQINTKIFAGEGHSTIEAIKVLYPNPDNLFSNPSDPYPDGLPIPLLEEKNDLGDGTVLSQKSAKITETIIPFEAKTKTFDDPENFLQHTNLPNSFLNEIISFLGGRSFSTSLYSPILPREILAISLASPAELLITDPQGRKLGFDYQSQEEKYEIPKGIYSGKGELELAAIIDPQGGEYKVSIIGNGDGEFNTGISYAKESCDNSVSQDNFGQTAAGAVTTFTINLQGDCQKDSVRYSLDSKIDIDPNVLNIDSKGNYITAYIELPNLYNVEDVDVSTIKLNNQISAIWFLKTIGDYDDDGITDLMVKFRRDEAQNIVSIGENKLSVSGNLRDGTRFEGGDIMRVIGGK